MSLEQSLQNIADALNNLALAVNAAGQTTFDFTKGQHSEATAGKSSKPAADKPKQDTAKPEAAATQPTAEAQKSAPAEKAESSAKPLVYDPDVRDPFLKYVSLYGKDAARALIAEYKAGAATLKEAITPDQYAEVLARLNQLIAEKA